MTSSNDSGPNKGLSPLSLLGGLCLIALFVIVLIGTLGDRASAIFDAAATELEAEAGGERYFDSNSRYYKQDAAQYDGKSASPKPTSGATPDSYPVTPLDTASPLKAEPPIPTARELAVSEDRRVELSQRRTDFAEGDKYEKLYENNFLSVEKTPFSTFSVDVDTASYAKVRQYLFEYSQLPPPDAVRIEELVNYFNYDYNQPTDEHPFATNVEVAECPWTPENRLVRVALQGKTIDEDARPAMNLVFLIDVSGSMGSQNRLPLLKKSLYMLVGLLGKQDRVSIVAYASHTGIRLQPTPGNKKKNIYSALSQLNAAGKTNGGAGIQQAYQLAKDSFIEGGVNRVILCSDGDFNVGTTDTDDLLRLVTKKAKENISLTVLGFGMGNLNDKMFEEVSNKGNGNYAFIDTEAEANKVLVEDLTGTLVNIAKDVKIQIEFNPMLVSEYRLIGYENRILAAKDFDDDKKDAGEIGAGHRVTAFYEVVPVAQHFENGEEAASAPKADELMTLKLRYKPIDEDKKHVDDLSN